MSLKTEEQVGLKIGDRVKLTAETLTQFGSDPRLKGVGQIQSTYTPNRRDLFFSVRFNDMVIGPITPIRLVRV